MADRPAAAGGATRLRLCRVASLNGMILPSALLLIFVLPPVFYFRELLSDPLDVARRILSSPAERAHLHRLAVRSLAIASGAATLATMAGLGVVICASGAGRLRRVVLGASAAAAFILPGHFFAIAWILNLGYASPLNRLLTGTQTTGASAAADGVDSILPRLLYSPAGSCLIIAMHLYPVCAAALLAGLRSVPRLQTESLRVTAGPQSLWGTLLRGPLSPWIVIGWLIVFLLALTDYSTPALLRHQTFTIEIMTAWNAQYDPPRAMALTLPVIFMAGVSAAALLLSFRRIESRSGGCTLGDLPAPDGPCGRILIRAIPLLAAASALVPLVTFLVQARVPEAWRLVFPGATDQAAHTLAILALALPVILGFALLAVSALVTIRSGSERRGRRTRALLAPVLLILFAMPPSVTAISMIRFWNDARIPGLRFDFYASGLMLPLGMACMYAPVAFLFALSRAEAVPRRLLDAEQLGHPPSAFPAPRLLWPTLVRPLLAAAAVATILIVHEAHAALLLVAPGQETLAIRSFTLLHYNPDSQVAAYCLLTVGFLCGLLLAGHLAFRMLVTLFRSVVPDYAID